MAEIRVTSEMLRDAAESFYSMESRLCDLVGQIKSEMNSMRGTWEGKTADSFIMRFNGIEQNLSAHSILMKEYAKFLDDSAQQYEDAKKNTELIKDSMVSDLFS